MPLFVTVYTEKGKTMTIIKVNANDSNEAKKDKLLELFALWHRVDYFEAGEVLDEIFRLSWDEEFINYLISSGTLIPVTEKLPDFDKEVITYDGHQLLECAYIEHSCWEKDGKPGWNGRDIRYPVLERMDRTSACP